MSGKDKVIDRLRKLFAHADSAKALGNEAEAEAFAAKAHELLAQHKLEMEDLTVEQVEAQEPFGKAQVDPFGYEKGGKKTRVAWTEQLADVVARAFHCRIMVMTKSSAILMVGRTSDRQVASYVFASLARFASEEAVKQHRKLRYNLYWNNGGDMSGAHEFKASFFRGFNERVRERFAAMRRKEEAAHTQYSVVVASADRAVESHMLALRNAGLTKSASAARGQSAGNASGREAGRAAGDRANLSGNGLRAGGSPSRGVSQGPRGLLGTG